MKTIVSTLIALSLFAGVAAPASAYQHSPKSSLGINNDANLP